MEGERWRASVPSLFIPLDEKYFRRFFCRFSCLALDNVMGRCIGDSKRVIRVIIIRMLHGKIDFYRKEMALRGMRPFGANLADGW